MMTVSYPRTTPILTECPDRRSHPRLEHREPVECDGRKLQGRDISARGLSIVVPPPVAVGDVVRVKLGGCADSGDAVMVDARVARVEATAEGFVLGLEFVVE